uniref:Uncharacterized protein n=1 Tax=Arundo donax TaxID=35708 RepID=A0A0A9BK04_ARUDO
MTSNIDSSKRKVGVVINTMSASMTSPQGKITDIIFLAVSCVIQI